jgi:MYXO-CTERM domain-containing protein
MFACLLPALMLLQEGGEPAPADTTMLRVVSGVGAVVLLGIVLLRRRSRKKKEEEF